MITPNQSNEIKEPGADWAQQPWKQMPVEARQSADKTEKAKKPRSLRQKLGAGALAGALVFTGGALARPTIDRALDKVAEAGQPNQKQKDALEKGLKGAGEEVPKATPETTQPETPVTDAPTEYQPTHAENAITPVDPAIPVPEKTTITNGS